MMIATEPLSAELWARIGLERGETFGDGRRVVIYGQRTADGRLAFGARGEYRYGSGIQDVFAADDPRFEQIRRALLELLPDLADTRITHRWGGPLGVPRDWRPSLGLDPRTRMGWLGGYDTIVIGSRAYEIDPALAAANERLLAFARSGGTLLVQYQQYQFVRGEYAPFRLTMACDSATASCRSR